MEDSSARVEELPATDLSQREAKPTTAETRTGVALGGFADLYREHGSLSEELEAP